MRILSSQPSYFSRQFLQSYHNWSQRRISFRKDVPGTRHDAGENVQEFVRSQFSLTDREEDSTRNSYPATASESKEKPESAELPPPSHSDKAQLRRQRSFFAQTRSLSGVHEGSDVERGDIQKSGEQQPVKNKSRSKDNDSLFFNTQIRRRTKSPTVKYQDVRLEDSRRSWNNGEQQRIFGSVQREAEPAVKRSRKTRDKSPKLSLFEELFPEEAAKQRSKAGIKGPPQEDLPRLALPGLEEDDGGLGDEYIPGRRQSSQLAETASKNAYQLWNPTVLVLQCASPSLDESDFRRIAPRGQHIEEWVGPGDFFKVIPARHSQTLEQHDHYFLVFPNPAYARAYQNHVTHLHRLARTHTPRSIESPIKPPKGMFIDGEEVYNLLQNYTLCPPSRKISLIGLFPPLSSMLQRILEHKGYPELTTPKDKTGRAVRFWVEGYVPTTKHIHQFLAHDGRQRGMAWALMNGKESVQQIGTPPENVGEVDEGNEHEGVTREGPDLRDYIRRSRIRWIISFEDEDEARRFVRRWHLRPFESAFEEKETKGDHAPLVHAEYLW